MPAPFFIGASLECGSSLPLCGVEARFRFRGPGTRRAKQAASKLACIQSGSPSADGLPHSRRVFEA